MRMYRQRQPLWACSLTALAAARWTFAVIASAAFLAASLAYDGERESIGLVST